jgi:hypothetical protein
VRLRLHLRQEHEVDSRRGKQVLPQPVSPFPSRPQVVNSGVCSSRVIGASQALSREAPPKYPLSALLRGQRGDIHYAAWSSMEATPAVAFLSPSSERWRKRGGRPCEGEGDAPANVRIPPAKARGPRMHSLKFYIEITASIFSTGITFCIDYTSAPTSLCLSRSRGRPCDHALLTSFPVALG